MAFLDGRLTLRLGLPAFAFSLMLALLVSLASRKSGRGFQKYFVPCAVSLAWWQLGWMFYTYMTLRGVWRAACIGLGLFYLPALIFYINVQVTHYL